MRFSGHETFSVREGWLHKGLRLLINDPAKLHDKYVADYMGVGSNMAKSIRHWLLATKLADIDKRQRGRILPTHFGEVIYNNDPYFLEISTWWFLHINMISQNPYADTWHWFFNSFNLERFDRRIVVENLRQFVQLKQSKIPSIKTLERDVACLLSSYSRHIPSENNDPEEARECPFRELELMSYYRTSGYYQMHFRVKEIHPCVFGYCIAEAYKDAGLGDIDIQRLVREQGGPGRAFVLTSETLHEQIINIINEYDDIHIRGHAGKRAVSVPRRNSIEWVTEFYNTNNDGSK